MQSLLTGLTACHCMTFQARAPYGVAGLCWYVLRYHVEACASPPERVPEAIARTIAAANKLVDGHWIKHAQDRADGRRG